MEVSTDVTVTDNTSEQTQNLTDDNGNQNLAKEEVPSKANDVSENFATFASESMDATHVTDYNSLNGIDATEAKNVVSDVGENGTTSVANEFMSSDAPVRANSLEFDVWTALIEETEKVAERRPEIHLFAAQSREHSGDIPGTRAAYQLVHAEIAPGLLEAIVKHANMEHRLGNAEDACSLYEHAIAIKKGKEHSQTLPQLFAQYSQFVYLICGKAEKAREILEQALENCQPSKSKALAISTLHDMSNEDFTT
ncbi:hypothetical protein POM88_039765 [Heracleum sosnowskyi]|uniref:Tetratricopeptide repeat protein n=1 Tax=Heracleum sosnowskyi TaxID=360622 RepID=A0AAD8M956_9APIA|nr:hypothetical protein POM88_039765 [Heracleum sosnowskyi]